MRKYMDVDVIAALGTVLETNTERYKSDFKYDIDMFKHAAAEQDADRHFLWLSQQHGTECFLERDTYLKDTYAHNSWKYFADSKQPIHAYAVEVTGLENGRVKGNLYELDHPAHAKQLERDVLPVHKVEAWFKDGSMLTMPFDEYNRNFMAIQNERGRIQTDICHPEDEAELQRRIQNARLERQEHAPAVFKVSISSRPSIHKQLQAGKELISRGQGENMYAKDACTHGQER